MTKEEIVVSLARTLASQESGAWKRIQNSLIGKELLSFGAEVILATSNEKDALVQAFDYKTADERALISMSHVYDIPVCFCSPSYIKVRLVSPTIISFKPFDIEFKLGNTVYTNIGYGTSNEDIVLYQGERTLMSNDDPELYNKDSKIELTEVILPITESSVIKGFNIGQAYPESVFVYLKDGSSVTLVSEFTPLSFSKEIYSYKYYTLFNKNLVILEGNGEWGKIADSTKYSIYYLKPTFTSINLENEVGDLLSVSVNGVPKSAHLLGAAEGFEGVIAAREYFRKYYLKLNAIVSKEQIREYTNSFPYIQDSKVKVTEDLVAVKVKPTDKNDIARYGEIQNNLSLYGGILVQYVVSKGTPLKFVFCSDYKDSSEIKSQIEEYLRKEFAYNNVTFDTKLDIADLSAHILAQYGVAINLYLLVSDVLVSGSTQLEFLPISGTIDIFKDNSRYGYDYRGQLFNYSDQGSQVVQKYSWLGELSTPTLSSNLVLSKFEFSKSLDGNSESFMNGIGADCNLNISQLSKDNCTFLSSNGYSFIFNKIEESTLTVFDSSAISLEGVKSVVPYIMYEVPVGDCTGDVDFAFIGGVLLKFVYSTDFIEIHFMNGVTSSPNFSTSVSKIRGSKIFGYYSNENDIYFIGESNTVYTIENVLTSKLTQNRTKIQLTDANETLMAVHAYDSSHVSLLVKRDEDNVVRIINASSLYLSAGEVIPSVTSEIELEHLEQEASEYSIHRTTDLVWVTPGVADEGEPGGYLPVIVFLSDSEVNKFRSYNQYKDESNVIGTVDYKSGKILLYSSLSVTLNYKASSLRLGEESYLQLKDESNPIQWI